MAAALPPPPLPACLLFSSRQSQQQLQPTLVPLTLATLREEKPCGVAHHLELCTTYKTRSPRNDHTCLQPLLHRTVSKSRDCVRRARLLVPHKNPRCLPNMKPRPCNSWLFTSDGQIKEEFPGVQAITLQGFHHSDNLTPTRKRCLKNSYNFLLNPMKKKTKPFARRHREQRQEAYLTL